MNEILSQVFQVGFFAAVIRIATRSYSALWGNFSLSAPAS